MYNNFGNIKNNENNLKIKINGLNFHFKTNILGKNINIKTTISKKSYNFIMNKGGDCYLNNLLISYIQNTSIFFEKMQEKDLYVFDKKPKYQKTTKEIYKELSYEISILDTVIRFPIYEVIKECVNKIKKHIKARSAGEVINQIILLEMNSKN
ncbi:hypothetical protein AB837_00639 [bacterium AB1]|nr:hypothetical protein AB837_00639 [bacterium AB1]